MRFGIVKLYCGKSGKQNFYNSQEIGLARAMKAFGHMTIIFLPVKNIKSLQEELVEKDILVVFCPAKSIGVHSYYDWNIIKKYSVDVIQIESDNQIFLPDLAHYCKKNKIKFYNYIGTIESDSSNGIKSKMLKILFSRNIKIYRKSQCFAKTDAVCKKLQELNVNHIKIAPVGLDLSVIPDITDSRNKLRNKWGIPADKLVMLFVGRIELYKEPLALIEIMRKMTNKLYYLIIGTGSMDSILQREIDKVMEKKNYKWIKEIPNVEIHQFYKLSDFFVNFNRKEIFGMSILEAMYHGCTVIANHAPGPDMIIRQGVNGYLTAETRDIVRYLNEESVIKRNKISEFIRNRFTWDQTASIVNEWIFSG